MVFATGMVGFEETLTDPSYYGQIITQTYPLIGNYGMNHWDMESGKVWARGYIVREACKTPSNWRSEETLDSFLKKNNIIGIEGIDTRHLTRIIRESGVMNGAILTEFDPADPANKERTEALLAEVKAYAVTGAVAAVTCKEPEVYNPRRLAPHRPDGLRLQAEHRPLPDPPRLQGDGDARLLHRRTGGRPEPGRHHAVQRPRRPRRAGGSH